MYLYGSEHALMDYHLNNDKKAEKPKEEPKPDNGASIDTAK